MAWYHIGQKDNDFYCHLTVVSVAHIAHVGLSGAKGVTRTATWLFKGALQKNKNILHHLSSPVGPDSSRPTMANTYIIYNTYQQYIPYNIHSCHHDSDMAAV